MKTINDLTITQEKLNLRTFEFDLKTTSKFIKHDGGLATITNNYKVSLSKHNNFLTLFGKRSDGVNGYINKDFQSIQEFEDWANNITERESVFTWIDDDTGIKKSQHKTHSRELVLLTKNKRK